MPKHSKRAAEDGEKGGFTYFYKVDGEMKSKDDVRL